MIRMEAPGARSGPKSDLRRNVGIAYGGVAVVKVPPLIGCVKYKAQDVVLSMRIPLLMHGKCVKGPKMLGFGCGSLDFGACLAGITRWLIGANLRVCAEGERRKAQEWCSGCGFGVVGGGKVGG